jgi:hypothetical protein
MIARLIHLLLVAALPASGYSGGDRAVPPGRPLPGAPLPPGFKKLAPERLINPQPIAAPHPSGAAVMELFEDDGSRMARLVETDEDPAKLGKIGPWGQDCFSGVCSLKVAGYQRYRTAIPGWGFPVVEKPKPGEYRYLRFAWKKVEGNGGIMVQLAIGGGDWGRYFAGPNTVGFYPAQQLAPQVPREWEVVTRDLYADFGSMPFNLNGFAFTSMDGVALFDHIYLGRTIADLDRLTDAARKSSRRGEPLGSAQLEEHWKNLASEDAAVRNPSEWALGASGAASVPFVTGRIRVPDSDALERKIAQAITDLDSPRYAVREKAAKELDDLGRTALPQVQAALKDGISPEWRMRLEKFLAQCKAEELPLATTQRQTLRAIRVLELAETPEAKKSLAALSKATLEAGLSLDAKESLERVEKRRK